MADRGRGRGGNQRGRGGGRGGRGGGQGANAAGAEAAPPPPPLVRYIYEEGLRRLPLQPVIRWYNIGDDCSALTVREWNAEAAPGLKNKSATEGPEMQFADINDRYFRGEYGIMLRSGKQFYTMLYFGCQISGLFYMGPTRQEPKGNDKHEYNYYRTVEDMWQYWSSPARQQWGWHVFCSQEGGIRMVALRIHLDNNVYTKNWSKVCPVVALYPTVRFEREEVKTQLGTSGGNRTFWTEKDMRDRRHKDFKRSGRIYEAYYWLTLGLVYDGVPNGPTPQTYNEKPGDRYYVRNGKYQDSHRLGNVCELTDPVLDSKLDKLSTPAAGRRWAVYVCAGAKLMVIDEYNTVRTEHNRALVQQGGIVAGRGQLYFGAPTSERIFAHHDHRYNAETVVEGAHHWFTGLSTEMRTKLDNITNPVVFLGPVESEYGSIAWSLSVIHPNLNEQRRCVVGIPEGGWFVAIEDWDAGIEEIKARHTYERLYESNVRMQAGVKIQTGHDFAAPVEALAHKIVGINADQRTINTDIIGAYARFNDHRPEGAVELTPLPVIYRCRRVTDWTVSHTIPKKGKQKEKIVVYAPPMPADWPLVQYGENSTKSCRMYYELGFLANGFKNTIDTLPVVEAERLYCVARRGHDKTTAPTMYKREGTHQFEMYEISNKRIFGGQPEDMYGGLNSYMGIDGWVYDYKMSNKLGKYTTDYYVPLSWPKVEAQVKPRESTTRAATPDDEVADDWLEEYDAQNVTQPLQQEPQQVENPAQELPAGAAAAAAPDSSDGEDDPPDDPYMKYFDDENQSRK